MPHYQFECRQCQNNFELELKMAELSTAHPAKTCPQCGGQNVFQVINFQGPVGVATDKSSKNPNCGQCGTTPGECPWQN